MIYLISVFGESIFVKISFFCQALNSSTATLSGTPTNSEVGNHNVILQVTDGTTTVDQNFTITVNGINDAPVADDKTFTTAENTNLSNSLTATDAEGSTLTYSIVSQGSKGTATINGATNGAFTYSPNTNINGVETFSYKVNDGSLNSNIATVTINITATSDAPLFNTTPISSVNENTLYTYDIVTSDVDGDTLTITAPTKPSWLTLTATGNGTATFTGTPGDNDTGNHNITLQVNDGSNTIAQSFTLTVNPINDPPSFTASNPPTSQENAGIQTLTGWITSFVAGPVDEGTQTASYTVSNVTNPGLFAVNPAISPSGVLTYTTATDANGSSNFSVQVIDNGGTANGGLNTSAAQSFTLTIEPLANTPGVTPASTVEDIMTTSGLVISRHPADGPEVTHFKITNIQGGTLYHNNGLTQINNGDFITFIQANVGLRFLPASNSFASGSFGIQSAQGNTDADLNGGLTTATITVTAVNDAPSFTGSNPPTSQENAGTQTITGWITNFVPGPADEASQIASYTVSNITNPGLFAINPAISSSGVLTYTTATDANGSASFSVQARDSGGTANGGIDTSAAQTFTIIVEALANTPGATPASTVEDIMTTNGLVISRHPADGPEVTHFKITNVQGGTLYHNNGITLINDGDFITFAQANVGLRFLPAPNSFAQGSFDIQSAQGNTDADLNGGLQTAIITVSPIADTPSVTNTSTEEGLQSTDGLVISRNEADGEEVTHFKITNIQFGSLYQNDGITPINLNDFITVEEGQAGLKFTPLSITNGQFDIQASLSADDTGLGGDVITATINLDLTNDAPKLSLNCTETETQCTLECLEQPLTEGSPETQTVCTMIQLFGGLVELTATATDPDVPEQNMRFSLTGAPPGALINPLTGKFDWQPTEPGTFTFSVIVTDDGTNPDNLTDSHELALKLTTDPVLIPIGDQIAPVDNLLAFTVAAIHHNAFTFSLENGPPDATLDFDSGIFNWTPTEEGEFTATIRVTEVGGLFTEETIAITVERNLPPVLEPLEPVNVLPNTIINFTALATDPNENALIYRLNEAPSGATIHPLSGTFTWIPTQTGSFTVTVIAEETNGFPENLSDEQSIDIFVNDKPVILPLITQNTPINIPLLFTINAMHAEDHPLAYTLVKAPSGASINPETGEFTWIPDAEGDYEVTVQVTETTDNLSSEATFKIAVSNNTPPELTPVENQVAPLNRLFKLQVEAIDAQENQLLYQIDEAPEGTVLHPLNGELTWIPDNVGTYALKLSVTEIDGIPINLTVSTEFQITVNTQPAIDDLENQSVNMGNTLTYRVTAFHPLGNPLGFRLVNNLSGAEIHPDTGIFTWTPEEAGIYDLQIQAFDKTNEEFTDTKVITLTANQVETRLALELSSNTILINGPLKVTGNVFREVETSISLGQLPIELTILGPNQTWNVAGQTQADGSLQFDALPVLEKEGSYLFQANFKGDNYFAESQSDQQTLMVRNLAGYAILIEGRTADDEEGLASYNKTMNRIYQKMKQRGFKDQDIEYFNFNLDQSNVGIQVDAEPSISAIKAAFDKVQTRLNAAPAPLFVVMVDHGGIDGSFYIDKGDGASIKPSHVSGWMNTLEKGLNPDALAESRVVIIGSCYAGTFLSPLSKQGRVIIASADTDEESFKGPKEPDETRSGEFFTEAMFSQLARGKSLKTAFELATETTETLTRAGTATNNRFQDSAAQHPLLDDDADKTGSNALSTGIGDGVISEDIYLGSGISIEDENGANNPAEILNVTETLHLEATTSASELFAVVNNASRVKDNQVIVDIRSPSISLVSEGTEAKSGAEINDLMRMFLSPSGEPNRFSGNLDVFQEPGQYEIMYFVVDTETGEMSPFSRSTVYKEKAGNRPPKAFQLIKPAHESKPETTMILNWESTFDPDGDPFTYSLFIATDPEFNKVVYREEELTFAVTYVDRNTPFNDSLKESGLGLRDGTQYYWKVEANDPFGGQTVSPVFSFTTNNTNAPPGIGSVFVSSALDFNGIDNAQLTFLDEFGNPIPSPDIMQDQGNYNMLLPAGRRRAIIKAAGFEDQEVEIDTSSGFASLNITLEPKGGIPPSPGQLQFTIDNTTIDENQETISMLVKREEGSDGEITVNYACVEETAIEGSDYDCPQEVLTWADQDTLSKRITLNIINDSAVEANESFNLILSNPTGGAKLLTRQMTVTIADDDLLVTSERGTLQFSQENYTANEADGRLLTLQVNRTSGSDGQVSVQYTTTTDSSATIGTDYTGGNGSLLWAEGDTAPKTINITLINEGEIEESEEVRFMLFNPTGDAQLGVPFQTTLTINDSGLSVPVINNNEDELPLPPGEEGQLGESQGQLGEAQNEGQLGENQGEGQLPLPPGEGRDEGPTLQFLADTYLTHEKIGPLTTFTVIRTGDSAGRVSVQYRIMPDSTAILDQDYTGGTGTLTWPDGDNRPQSIDLTLLDDEDIEGPETLVLELYEPSGMSLGTPSQSTLIITDDDQPPPTESPSDNEGTIIEESFELPNAVQFSSKVYAVTEEEGVALLPVERIGDNGEAIQVQYFASGNSTATVGVDYKDHIGTLTWAAGDTEPKLMVLRLIDDNITEAVETVHLMLFNPSQGLALGTPADTRLLIVDNQSDPLFLPSLGRGIVITEANQTRATQPTQDAETTPVTTAFRGGASVNGLDYQTQLFMSPMQYVNIIGDIQINSQHVGQVADILIVVAVLSTIGDIELFVMRNTQGDIEVWEGEDMTRLVPVLENITLGETQRVDIYQGLLGNGHLFVFFGYRLKDSGFIVYNGEQPIEVNIENEVIAQPQAVVWQADFSPDGDMIVTASHDGNIRLWDAKTGDRLALLKGHTEAVKSMTFNSSGTQLVTASNDGTARIWDIDFQTELTQLKEHTSTVESASFSTDDQQIITASQDGTARIWDAETGQLINILKGHQGAVNMATFNTSGTQIVTASQDNTARLWHAETSETLAILKHDHVVEHAAFSPDGKLVVTASWDGTARVWNAESGEEISELKHHNGVSYATFSPDGSLIVTTSWDKTACLWETPNRSLSLSKREGEPIETEAISSQSLAILIGHQGVVNYATFSPDGQRLVTASSDNTARVWEVETGQPLAILKGHTNNVGYAAFSPDGEKVVTASWDNTARVWNAQTGELLMLLKD